LFCFLKGLLSCLNSWVLCEYVKWQGTYMRERFFWPAGLHACSFVDLTWTHGSASSTTMWSEYLWDPLNGESRRGWITLTATDKWPNQLKWHVYLFLHLPRLPKQKPRQTNLRTSSSIRHTPLPDSRQPTPKRDNGRSNRCSGRSNWNLATAKSTSRRVRIWSIRLPFGAYCYSCNSLRLKKNVNALVQIYTKFY
jgi:hypothetical protein